MSETTTTTLTSKTQKISSIVPSPRIAIVDLTPNNIGTLRKLNSVLFPVSYSDKFYHDVLENHLSDFCKLIYYNDLPVGGVCCRIEPDPKLDLNTVGPVDNSSSNEVNGTSTQTKLYIMTLGVLAPYRQQGLATKLLDQVISAAQKTHLSAQSTSKTNVEVSTTNTAAHATTSSTAAMIETKKTHSKGKKSAATSKPIERVELPSVINNSNHSFTQAKNLPGKETPQIKIPSISSAYVHVQIGNDDAREFYINRGFKVQGEVQDYYRKIEPRGAWILATEVTGTS